MKDNRYMLSALYLATFINCGSEEVKIPHCQQFKNIAEQSFAESMKGNGWDWLSDHYACVSTEPPCLGDESQQAILTAPLFGDSCGSAESYSSVKSTLTVPQQSRIDRVVLNANIYSRRADVNITIDDYGLNEQHITERDDCSANSIIVDLYQQEDFHSIGGDGRVNVKVLLKYCFYCRDDIGGIDCEKRKGCVGLSKVILQDCVDKK